VTGLSGVIFDLDDTILDHGALSERAYAALFRLRDAGLRLLACTGRPAGWGHVIQRQWPLDATVVENGSIGIVSGDGGRLVIVDHVSRDARRSRRAVLLDLAREIVARHPTAALVEDNDTRLSDVALDIGELCGVTLDEIAAIRAMAREARVTSLVSSIHLHLCPEPIDKAVGVVRLLTRQYGEDATSVLGRYAYVGDSTNDAACFAAFQLTFGVANVRTHLPALSLSPRFVSRSPMGAGFSEIAARIVELRR
jgi:HAD superfamily hydrolase (TIGR01484 family)